MAHRSAPAVHQSPIQLVSQRLEQMGKTVRETRTGYMARCPAHDDRKPSLKIDQGESDRVLLKCHAGCSTEDVVAALGLELHDLFPRSDNGAGAPIRKETSKTWADLNLAVRDLARRGRHGGTWQYEGIDGKPVMAVVRIDEETGKTFRQLHPVSGGWQLGAPPAPRPIYMLPAVIASTGTIYITEGEKCADALVKLGLTATTSPGGAKSADKADWRPLADREVVILPDNDPQGLSYATGRRRPQKLVIRRKRGRR